MHNSRHILKGIKISSCIESIIGVLVVNDRDISDDSSRSSVHSHNNWEVCGAQSYAITCSIPVIIPYKRKPAESGSYLTGSAGKSDNGRTWELKQKKKKRLRIGNKANIRIDKFIN